MSTKKWANYEAIKTWQNTSTNNYTKKSKCREDYE